MFIRKHVDQIDKSLRVGDIGAGHLRNLKLFEDLGFTDLYAVDRETTDNPLAVKLKEFIVQDIEEGIPFADNFFDITLCNYVLMFINQSSIYEVLDELMRVTNKFLIIETYPKKYNSKTTFHKDYDFLQIVKHIEKNPSFELIQTRNYYEKLIAKRK